LAPAGALTPEGAVFALGEEDMREIVEWTVALLIRCDGLQAGRGVARGKRGDEDHLRGTPGAIRPVDVAIS
jgi:hypothetical protein